MDRYMKVVFTVIAIALVSLAVKDVDLFPVAEAQQGWEIGNELPMNGSMQALPWASDYVYVCTTTYIPRKTTAGIKGFVSVSFYSEPDCQGSNEASGRLYGEGATHSDAHSYYMMSESELMYVANSLDRAAETGQQVQYFRCSDDSTYCIKYMQFRTHRVGD